MEFGNKYVGCSMHKDYSNIFIFPLGIELCSFNEDVELGITIWPFQITFGLGGNKSLFKG